ncbi:MAG: 3-methyladenine DNA glycosylase [Epsilonproteobacteria bacterium]|nr:3-methyladenine DNA glycosylase [Campylobacterota bacterium]
MIENSFDLLKRLLELGYDRANRDDWWWPNSGTFEVVVGAILTQNSKWERVEISLENLRKRSLLSLESLALIDLKELEELIRPSGFFRAKSKYIKGISQAILDDFISFDNFKEEVDREWLLAQKGIGFESADAILNYGCKKEAFVVDSYSQRLLNALGYEFDRYEDIQEWFISGIWDRYNLLFPSFSRAKVYARAHGMIVEYCKENKKGSKIDISKIKDEE